MVTCSDCGRPIAPGGCECGFMSREPLDPMSPAESAWSFLALGVAAGFIVGLFVGRLFLSWLWGCGHGTV